MISYNPQNWYWYVGGDTSKAFSSASGDYVPSNDPTFTDWVAQGNVPTAIDSEANLGEVLAPYAIRPVAANVLDSYKSVQANQITVATIAKILFNHENRIRALEGQSTITAAQFKAAIKALM